MIEEKFLIDRKLIGTKKHLLVDGGVFSFVDHVLDNVWFLDGNAKNDCLCLDTLLKLNSISIDLNPPQKFVDSMSSLMSGSVCWPPPWCDVMPKAAHRTFVQRLVSEVQLSLHAVSREFYDRVWVPGNAVFSSLERACVDENVWKTYIDSGEGNIGALRSFKPSEDGKAQSIVYNRFGSRTGRPTVGSGPNILTLKREQRNLIKSRWGSEGKIVLLDFSALEIRVVLYEAGQRCDADDVYDEINKQVFEGAFDRKVVKGVVISDLYGQSKWAVGQRLGITGKQLDFAIEKIKAHFKTQLLLKRIKQQFVEKGYILNRYSRRVHIDEPLDHMLINSYAQSTGADVVTLGFKKIIDALKGSRSVPIFLLVDAIMIDCHNDDIETIKQLKNITVDGYVQRWPLKVDIIQ